MSIAMTCAGCQYPFQVPPAAAGRRVACPKCQTPIRVPVADPPPAPVASPASMPVQSNGPLPAPVRAEPLRIVITDFDIKFASIVGLMVKITLAAIPAAIILGAVFALVALALVSLTGGVGLPPAKPFGQ